MSFSRVLACHRALVDKRVVAQGDAVVWGIHPQHRGAASEAAPSVLAPGGCPKHGSDGVRRVACSDQNVWQWILR